MKMEEEQMDLIVGVDFGMTCTGMTTSSITPSLPGGSSTPDKFSLTVHLKLTHQANPKPIA